MTTTPVLLPSLRFEAMGPRSIRASRPPQLRSKAVSPKRFDPLPALSKQLCQQPDTLPQTHHSLMSSQPELAWRSTLTAEQATAIAIAQQETGYTSPSINKSKLLGPSLHADAVSATTTEDWKKTRRKEQCRINQANYRKRKRQYEQNVLDEIKALEQEIEQLETHRTSGSLDGPYNAIESIGDFYHAVGIEGKQQRIEMGAYRLCDGSSPALQNLLDLQREEFDSVESFKLHWLWYREQLRIFRLSIASCERLEAGEHVIIKITGQLQLDVYYDAQQQNGESTGYGVIMCPITQQFEFESGDRVITRITSEVDLIAGVAAAQDLSAPECTLTVLHCLSEGFHMSNAYRNI